MAVEIGAETLERDWFAQSLLRVLIGQPENATSRPETRERRGGKHVCPHGGAKDRADAQWRSKQTLSS